MPYELTIALRYLRARRRERFVSLIAIISLAGVTLGSFALSVALSVMSGFEIDLRARLLAFTPQITIERTDNGVWNPAELEKKIAAGAFRCPTGEAVAKIPVGAHAPHRGDAPP